MTDCNICTEKIDNHIRKEVVCAHCHFSACNKCCRKYLCDSLNNAHCMSCKKEWNREFMSKYLTKSWVNKEYKNHREEVLLERQKAMLPETQKYVESHNQINKNRESVAKLETELREEYRKHQIRIDQIYKEMKDAKELYRMKQAVYEHNSFEHRHFLNSDNADEVQPGKPDETNNLDLEEEREKNIIHGNCPVAECRGFIGRGWVCGVCETRICSRCMEIKEYTDKITGIGHVCDEEVRKNVESLKKETKLCPGCHAPVFKSSGCYQIWCTQCHTTFHYSTGEIITTERIHNPHYTEYLLNNQVNGNANRCGGIDFTELRRAIKKEEFITYKGKVKYKNSNRLKKMLSVLNYVNEIMGRRLLVRTNSEKLFRRLRIDFMRNYINEEDFKIQIQRLEKAVDKEDDIIQIREMFCNVVQDYLQMIIEKKLDEKDAEEKIQELIFYSNEQLELINKNYNSYSDTRLVPNDWGHRRIFDE